MTLVGRNQIFRAKQRICILLCRFHFLVQQKAVKGFTQGTDRMELVFLKEWMEKGKKWENYGNGNGRGR